MTEIENCQINVYGACMLCNDLYFLDNNACLPCSADCVFCTSLTICGICADSNMEPTITGQCKSKCLNLQNNQYCDDSVPKTCEPGLKSACKCGSAKNCASCSSANQCKTCLEGFKMSNGLCNSCLSGYNLILTHTSMLCLPSDNPGTNCQISINGICKQCSESFYVKDGKCYPCSDDLTLCPVQKGISTGAIVGIVIGTAIFISLIIGIIVWVFIMRRKSIASNSVKVVGI